MVLGLRRPVLPRAARLRLRADPLEHLAQLLRRPQHRHPDRVRGARQLRRHAVRPGVPLQPAHLRRLRRVHRADDVRSVPRGWRCWSTAPGGSSRSSGRCSSCRPRAPTWSPRWSGRCRSSPGSGSGWPTRCSAGSASRRSPWLVGDPAALVLAGHRHRAPLAAGRLLHDPVPRRPATDLADALRGGGHRRRGRAGRCCATSPCRSCAATSSAVLLLLLVNAFQAFDEFYNLLSSTGQYPPYARPPLVYLYYTALGSGQDFGHGSAGAVILTLVIAVVALGQGRLMRFGRED